MSKVILIVLDSFGVGALPDAAAYGDESSDTYGHIYTARGLALPNMFDLGFANIDGLVGPKAAQPRGAYGKCAERSAGKDTTTGHWELCGIVLDKPFPTYPQGFPQELISELTKAFGIDILGNEVASGTEIIARLGYEHELTGKPIVYTSADSVLQIATHTGVIPLERLYALCRQARHIMQGRHAVGRIIARPFDGKNGEYKRTPDRRDFSLEPVADTVLDMLKAAGKQVIGVGKIEDIFAGRGLTEAEHTVSNADGIRKTIEYAKRGLDGLLFTNLVDYDMLYGHRNDVEGYARALEEFDAALPQIMDSLSAEDMLIISSDHGCDPTTQSTDHSREYTPLLVFGQGVKPVNLGVRGSFCDIGAFVLDCFGLQPICGESFYKTVTEGTP